MEMLVYVLLMFKNGEQVPDFNVHFRTLSECGRHKVAIERQSGEKYAFVLPKTNKFQLVCYPKLIDSRTAGTDIVFHDIVAKKVE